MKKYITILPLLFILGCSPKISEPVIKTGEVIGTRNIVVEGTKVFVLDYLTQEGDTTYRILYQVQSLKPGDPFKYIEE